VQYSNPAILPQHRTNNLPQSRSHLSLQITHPAAFASDPQNEAEYSPLEAPALPFSSSGSPRRSRTRSAESNGRQFGSTLPTRPTSSSSLPSLAVTSSTSWSPHTPSSDSTESLPSTSSSRRDMHGRGLSDAQEELLVEARSDRENGKDVNPYAWERPLDSINRVSTISISFPSARTYRILRSKGLIDLNCLTLADPESPLAVIFLRSLSPLTALENAGFFTSHDSLRSEWKEGFSSTSRSTDARSIRIQSSCRRFPLRPRAQRFFPLCYSRYRLPFSFSSSSILPPTSTHFDLDFDVFARSFSVPFE